MKSKLILITGGAGFIGSHLADQLKVLGYSPQVALHQGLAELPEWLRGQVATDRVAQARAELEARGLTV